MQLATLRCVFVDRFVDSAGTPHRPSPSPRDNDDDDDDAAAAADDDDDVVVISDGVVLVVACVVVHCAHGTYFRSFVRLFSLPLIQILMITVANLPCNAACMFVHDCNCQQ